jgi:hypothetical protein
MSDDHSPTGGGTQGRSDSPNGSGNQNGGSHEKCTKYSSRQGSVVIRASVEHTGVVGDAEMTVTVKWPASSFCAPPCAQSTTQCGPTPDGQQVPGTGPLASIGPLYGESVDDPKPAVTPSQPSYEQK